MGHQTASVCPGKIYTNRFAVSFIFFIYNAPPPIHYFFALGKNKTKVWLDTYLDTKLYVILNSVKKGKNRAKES